MNMFVLSIGWNGWNAFNPLLWRRWNDCSAFFTRTQLFVAGKCVINLPHRIGAIVADFGGGFIYLLAAFAAEPFKIIDLAGLALALKHDEPGIGFEAGRVRDARGAKKDLARFDVGGVLGTGLIAIDQVLHAGQL